MWSGFGGCGGAVLRGPFGSEMITEGRGNRPVGGQWGGRSGPPNRRCVTRSAASSEARRRAVEGLNSESESGWSGLGNGVVRGAFVAAVMDSFRSRGARGEARIGCHLEFGFRVMWVASGPGRAVFGGWVGAGSDHRVGVGIVRSQVGWVAVWALPIVAVGLEMGC